MTSVIAAPLSNRVLQKVGTINVALKKSVFQPSNSGFKAGPRFWGLDGTGQYWGPNGYYRSTPCWGNVTSPIRANQFSGFSVSPYGCYDLSALTAAPNQYASDPSATAQATGQAPFPLTTAPGSYQAPGRSCQGLQGVYSQSFWEQGGATGFRGFRNSLLKTPLTLFENLTINPVPATAMQQDINTLVDTFAEWLAPPIFTVLDDFKGEHCVSGSLFTVDFYGDDLPQIATDILDNSPYQQPILLTKNGTAHAVWSFLDHLTVELYSVKVNPVNGNCIVSGEYGGKNGPYVAGNVFCKQNPSDIFLNVQYLLSLSDADDQTLMPGSRHGAVAQFAGGWFGLFGTSGGTIFLVDQSISNYYRVNFTVPSGVTFSPNPETMAIDFAGNWYYLDYSSGYGTFSYLYSNAGQPQTIQLVVPNLTAWGVTCQPDNSCQPWM